MQKPNTFKMAFTQIFVAALLAFSASALPAKSTNPTGRSGPHALDAGVEGVKVVPRFDGGSCGIHVYEYFPETDSNPTTTLTVTVKDGQGNVIGGDKQDFAYNANVNIDSQLPNGPLVITNIGQQNNNEVPVLQFQYNGMTWQSTSTDFPNPNCQIGGIDEHLNFFGTDHANVDMDCGFPC